VTRRPGDRRRWLGGRTVRVEIGAGGRWRGSPACFPAAGTASEAHGADLPESVRAHLPKHARDIFRAAFNNAEEEYGEEERAFRVARAAVQEWYEKGGDGNWHPKEGCFAGRRTAAPIRMAG
jgi:cation transport regulator